MVFLFVVLIILLLVVVSYSNLELEIINIDFNSQNKKKLNSNYKYIIRLKILSKITILKITFTQNKIEKILSKIDVDKKIEKFEEKIQEKRYNSYLKFLKTIGEELLKEINIKSMEINIVICTENALLTSMIVSIVSSVISIIMSIKYNGKEKFIYQIKPMFSNQNLINVKFAGIFQIKMIHIIHAICIVKKKWRSDKYERTSDRRTYDYSYE